MPDTDLHHATPLHIGAEFPPVTTEQWEALIQVDLKGADYDKRLVWRTEEGIAVRPYYRSGDASPADVAPGEFPFTRGKAGGWAVAQDFKLSASAVDASRFHESGATAVQELACAIAEGVDRLAAAPDPAAQAAALTFVFSIGSNYFFEIAKLRAARLLWARAVTAFSPQAGDAARMRIHARTALANKSIYDPYTNLLRVTTEALSAALGGCDSLEVVPARFSQRMAGNVQLVLKEEAHVDAVADPAGGSYYVETLTDSLAAAAWSLFQQIEEKGGFAKAQDFINAQVAEARAAKEKAMASRRKVMVGVNNYPDTKETALAAASEIGPGWRQSQAIESIRLRTERHAKAAGKTPRILLLKRGDLKMKTARGAFCLNFFGCGGFDIVESEGLDPVADLIVLCSSDSEYVEFARDVAAQTKTPIVVAGNPKESIEELKTIGVAGFVHVLSNQVDTLREWQDRLGVRN
ncbi:MAG TPA: methylmalonyl-CoA mutase family protein [Bryobacteraceae bacterium]|nr:methylmalonyl-CoA mutase family protein [Bryobacteraceae bacterium]